MKTKMLCQCKSTQGQRSGSGQEEMLRELGALQPLEEKVKVEQGPLFAQNTAFSY